ILSETTGLTQTGVAMGTPAYMSPEQWQGYALDARTDIYALGVILFEMLTGRQPFSADTPASMMYKHLQETPPSISEVRSDVPPGVEGVIEKALAKNRDQRFSSAGELARAFEAALAGQRPVAGQQPSKRSGGTTINLRREGRSGWWGILILVGLLALGGIAAVWLAGN